MSSPEHPTTAMVADSLDAVGHRSQVIAPEIEKLTSGSFFMGRARTIRFAPTDTDPDDPYGDMIDAIDDLRVGDVVIIATSGGPRAAVWGELFSAAALGRGAVGLVADGWVRDLPGIRGQGFPVLARGTHPVDYRGRLTVIDRDVPVVCGGVCVSTGDLIVADDDGAVVVPADAEEEVMALARDRAGGERTVMTELRDGAGLRAVWERHRIL